MSCPNQIVESGVVLENWWKGAVIYQVYPRSFQDDDGDGLGDLKGITRRLPYIAGLGVDAVWLSPIFTSPMKDMGYDVSDYCDIDPQFGTLADFDELISVAHGLGLKIIIDQVLSHTSDKHAWFVESRKDRANDKADWYVWAEPKPDGSVPNNWPSVFGGPAWEWEPRRRQYYLHNFLSEQPDLNMHNPDVQDAILDVMRFWLERGVDGFRLDTVNYYFHDRLLQDNPPNPNMTEQDTPSETYGWQEHKFSKNQPENIAFLERMRALTNQFDARMMVGEVGDAGETGIKIMGEYTEGTARLHMCYNFEMLGPNYSAGHFRGVISGFQQGAPEGWPSWSFSNHDVPRHVTRWNDHCENRDDLAKQTILMLCAFEGSIGIYQGEELGLEETEMEYHELTDPPGLRFWPEVKGRDGCRTPMVWDSTENGGFSSAKPWLPVKSPQLARNVASQEGKQGSVLEFYREILGFRKSSETLISGSTRFLDTPEPILAFVRGTGAEALLCVFNLSSKPVSIEVDGLGALTGPSVEASVERTTISLGPNGAVLITPANSGEEIELAG